MLYGHFHSIKWWGPVDNIGYFELFQSKTCFFGPQKSRNIRVAKIRDMFFWATQVCAFHLMVAFSAGTYTEIHIHLNNNWVRVRRQHTIRWQQWHDTTRQGRAGAVGEWVYHRGLSQCMPWFAFRFKFSIWLNGVCVMHGVYTFIYIYFVRKQKQNQFLIKWWNNC